MVMTKHWLFYSFSIMFLFSCGSETNSNVNDSVPSASDSALQAQNLVANDKRNINDTVFHTALPPVFDGDIIMQNCRLPQPQLLGLLMGGKYNHVGLIFKRDKDGLLMVMEMLDSSRATPLTEFVDRGGGQVCLLRLKNASVTLNEEKTTKLRAATKAYRKKPFDPVLNWDDSGLYSSEVVWKVYNNAMMLKLCPTRTVKDFDISEAQKKDLNKKYGMNVSDRDEAVSPDDIYNSPKLEIIFEK